jgi:hypothetical protein
MQSTVNRNFVITRRSLLARLYRIQPVFLSCALFLRYTTFSLCLHLFPDGHLFSLAITSFSSCYLLLVSYFLLTCGRIRCKLRYRDLQQRFFF